MYHFYQQLVYVKKSATRGVHVGLNWLLSCLNPADGSITTINDLLVFGKSILTMLAAVFAHYSH